MRMQLEGFERQDRGPYRFDRWHWPERVSTQLGNLIVELTISDGKPPPDAAMVTAANELVEFVTANGDMLLDLIYGHYRCAEENGWLKFWGVRRGLRRDRILSLVESIMLTVRRDKNGYPDMGVFVTPRWDPEHSLDLAYHDGRIVSINGRPYVLDGEVLRPR